MAGAAGMQTAIRHFRHTEITPGWGRVQQGSEREGGHLALPQQPLPTAAGAAREMCLEMP